MAADAKVDDRTTPGWLMSSRSNAWTDLALTLPIFLCYHLGVVLLEVRNAADLVTMELTRLAERSIVVYWGLTLSIAAGMVTLLVVLGRGEAFEKKRFALVACEGVAYAVLMRMAGAYAVGSLPMAVGGATPFTGLVMSLGAGFYEEVLFRVGLFGLGALAIRAFFGTMTALALTATWGLVCAMVFAGWHYVGALGDPWDLRTFVFRTACGVVLTAIYFFRGFAPAVWTHTLYDLWVLLLV